MKLNVDNVKIDKIKSDALVVTTDFYSEDVGTLLITRPFNDLSFQVVNEFHGDKASGIYHLLTGGAELMQEHGHWFLLDECANAGVYCSVCKKKVYKEHYANVKEKSRFCPNCGAIMDGKFRVL